MRRLCAVVRSSVAEGRLALGLQGLRRSAGSACVQRGGAALEQLVDVEAELGLHDPGHARLRGEQRVLERLDVGAAAGGVELAALGLAALVERAGGGDAREGAGVGA